MPVLAFALAVQASSTDKLGTESYLKPPPYIESAAMAPWWLNVSLTNVNASGTFALVTERDGPPTLAIMSRPAENLGGVQVDIRGVRARSLTTSSAAGMKFYDFANRRFIKVEVPNGARVGSPVWGPDSETVAFFAHFDDKSEVWTAQARTGRATRASKVPAMPTTCTSLIWTKSGVIAAAFQPEGFRRPDPRPETPLSPRVQISDTKGNRLRTYAGLLQTVEDQRLLESYATSQIGLIKPNGQFVRFGKPGMWRSITVSNGGEFIRGRVMEKPFSYLVPASSFGEREIVIDGTGKELKELSKRALQLGEYDPNATATPPTPPTTPDPLDSQDVPEMEQGGRQRADGAQGQNASSQPINTGRRNIEWHRDKDALTYLQLTAEDAQKNRKDQFVLWKAPFGDKDIEVLYETPGRISSVRYGNTASDLFVTLSIDNRTRTDYVNLKSGKTVTLIGPGSASSGSGDSAPAGTLVLEDSDVRMSADGKLAYLSGTRRNDGASTTFFDSISLEDGKRTRLIDGKPNDSLRMIRSEPLEFMATRQSATEPPNNFLVKPDSLDGAKLTNNVDYTPDLTQAKRETVTVTRADGKTFRVVVTMMEGAYRRPAFFWFYPREYVDQAAYNRTLATGGNNAQTFRQVGGGNKAILLRAGYVLVEPDCPIFGAIGKQNDSYVPQLRNNLSAVIDELHERGWIDRKRIGLGGHSYGAFSTVNAMVHTPFFKCGIAGDGNFNRVLTPFGFQSEQRMLWEGREMYLNMSPILYAEQLTGALLLYHGEQDQNVGTALMNSERLFASLEALGKPAALYIYPYEDHGQIAKETILDQWARWIDWLDKYLK